MESQWNSSPKNQFGRLDFALKKFCRLLQNYENKTQEMLFLFQSEKDRLKWTEAVTFTTSEVPAEKNCEDLEAPKIEATDYYDAKQEDELTMQKGETGNILRKLEKGWLFVERSSVWFLSLAKSNGK